MVFCFWVRQVNEGYEGFINLHGNHMQFIPSFCARMVSSCRINMITMPAKMIRRSCGVSMAFHRNYHQSDRDETPFKPPKQGSKSLNAQETRIQQSWWEDIHVYIYIYIYILFVRTCYIYFHIFSASPAPLCHFLVKNDIPCFTHPRWSQPFRLLLAFLCTSANFQLKAWKILVAFFGAKWQFIGCFFWCQKHWTLIFWGTINRSITHTLPGDPAGTHMKKRQILHKPPSRLKLLLRKRCGTRPDVWNNEGSRIIICHLSNFRFNLVWFFPLTSHPQDAPKKKKKAFGNIFSTRKKHTAHGQLSDRSEELIQNKWRKTEKKRRKKKQTPNNPCDSEFFWKPKLL